MACAILCAGCVSKADHRLAVTASAGDEKTGVLARSVPGPTNCGRPEHVSEATIAAVATGTSSLAFRLLGQLTSANRNGNVFFSPYSIATTVDLAYQGARGETAAQLGRVLDIPGLSSRELAAGFGALACRIEADGKSPRGGDVFVADALFEQRGMPLQQLFTQTLNDELGAPPTLIDFKGHPEQARDRINTWVSQQTDGMIPQLLPPGSAGADSRLVLVDAISLREIWTFVFDPERTAPAPFHLTGGRDVRVPMMSVDMYGAGYYSDANVTVAELPLENSQVAIDFLQPSHGSLEALEASLSDSGLQARLGTLKARSVSVKLPKFNLDWKADLVPTFQRLGLNAPFAGEKADFSGMDGARDLWISLLQHEAVLQVGERGVTAAAATALDMVAMGMPPRPDVSFTADRPFLVVIRDVPTGALLFLGQVMDPSLGEH